MVSGMKKYIAILLTVCCLTGLMTGCAKGTQEEIHNNHSGDTEEIAQND